MLLVPELSSNETSLLWLAESLDSIPRLYVGHVRFELVLPSTVAIGIAILGGTVSVGAWAAEASPAGGAVLPTSPFFTAVENKGSSW